MFKPETNVSLRGRQGTQAAAHLTSLDSFLNIGALLFDSGAAVLRCVVFDDLVSPHTLLCRKFCARISVWLCKLSSASMSP
eukprot:40262-Eustigmatos_ZCMA.PRE.1